jgi:hypothetical protein
MAMGYTSATGEFTKGSSVVLRDNMRVNDSEDVRKSCYKVRWLPLRLSGPAWAGAARAAIVAGPRPRAPPHCCWCVYEGVGVGGFAHTLAPAPPPPPGALPTPGFGAATHLPAPGACVRAAGAALHRPLRGGALP